MTNNLMLINVSGNRSTWGFCFYGDPKHIPEWQADGLDVRLMENDLPQWVAVAGSPAMRAWCFLQDLFNFRNPWRK